MSPLLFILQCFVGWLAKRKLHFTGIYRKLELTQALSLFLIKAERVLWCLDSERTQETSKLLV